MTNPQKIVKKILGDKVSRNNINYRNELIQLIMSKTTLNKQDAALVADDLIEGRIPYLQTNYGKIKAR